MVATDEMSISSSQEEVAVDQSRLRRHMGYCLSRAGLQVRKLITRRLVAMGLNSVEFSILVLCDANTGINLRQLGDALDISPPNLVQVIDRLIKRKLLKRVRSRLDRRIQHIHLTADGSALLAVAEKEVAELEREISNSFTAAERKALMKGLRKLALL
ncbi:MAG: MarR family transcriptional regulator [Steroidobacteraceae bacterium]